MKSILISFIMFAVVLAAMYVGVFEILDSVYTKIFAGCCLMASLIFALKVLGSPWTKDKNHDKD